MPDYNKTIPEDIPDRIRRLPVDHRGYPVPWFVAWVDGKPDHRVVDGRKLPLAVNQNLCWICGEPLGVHKAFVLGPMCAVNRTTSEPPAHRECAEFSARACPFLTIPAKRRRETNLPECATEPAGFFLKRNPAAVGIWITKSFRLFRAQGGGVLFRIGEPTEVLWFTESREATREEVEASIASGYPALEEVAKLEGPDALEALDRAVSVAKHYLPK